MPGGGSVAAGAPGLTPQAGTIYHDTNIDTIEVLDLWHKRLLSGKLR